MCQFVNVLDVEVLPPYMPSAAEQADAALYAANVRALYAAQTGWPLVEQSQREFTALCKVRLGRFCSLASCMSCQARCRCAGDSSLTALHPATADCT